MNPANAAPYSPFQLVPEWYLARYMRDSVSFRLTLLAVVHWFAKMAASPIELTVRALQADSILLFELMAVGTEALFVLWLWHGSMVPPALQDSWQWTIICSGLFIWHLHAVRASDVHWRIVCLVMDQIWWSLTLFSFLRSGRLYLGEIFLLPLIAAGILAIATLKRSPHGAAHGEQ